MLEQVQTEKRDDLPSKILAMPNVDRYKMESIVWAAPMKLGEYAKLRGVPLPENENPDANGFLVEHCFHDNPSEIKNYVNNYRKVAIASANAIQEYYQNR